MNPIVGWALAALAMVAGWVGYGWQGLILAVTVIVFWLLLQFNRVLRVMKNAAHAPVGFVKSGVMFNAKLRRGMAMVQVVQLTRSLGRKLDDAGDVWSWTDAGGVTVRLAFQNGRLATWQLTRETPPDEAATPPT